MQLWATNWKAIIATLDQVECSYSLYFIYKNQKLYFLSSTPKNTVIVFPYLWIFLFYD